MRRLSKGPRQKPGSVPLQQRIHFVFLRDTVLRKEARPIAASETTNRRARGGMAPRHEGQRRAGLR